MYRSTVLAVTATFFCVVLLTFGRMPVVTRWIRASVLEVLLARLLELLSGGTASCRNSSFRSAFPTVFSWLLQCRRRGASGLTLVLTLSTPTRVVFETARVVIGTLFLWLPFGSNLFAFVHHFSRLCCLFVLPMLLSRFDRLWPQNFDSVSVEPRTSLPCFSVSDNPVLIIQSQYCLQQLGVPDPHLVQTFAACDHGVFL